MYRERGKRGEKGREVKIVCEEQGKESVRRRGIAGKEEKQR